MADVTWKEGTTVSVMLDGERTRTMRVVCMRRAGPNTVDLTLEAVSGPDDLLCTCPYIEGPFGVRMGTNRACAMHGEDAEAFRAPARAPDPDKERLSEAHERIAAMPKEKQRKAYIRASRSYSAPRMCVEHDGCHIDSATMEMVWPDGERWPMRSAKEGA